MRHKKSKSLNNRFTSWRKATLSSIARSVLVHQSIRTTKIKASSAQPLIENLITLAKSDTLIAKRRAFDIIQDHSLVSYLFKEIGPRFTTRTGGYTRIMHAGQRRGDGADLVILELTEIKKKETKKLKKAKAAPEEHVHEGDQPAPHDEPIEEKKPTAELQKHRETRPPQTKKPPKKFLGGLRNIFKKERDSL
jgi:large subunit ribosomal protein L17